MTSFRYRICEPLSEQIRNKGFLPANRLPATFEHFPWSRYIAEMEGADLDELYFAPSIEFESEDGNHELSVSAVGDPDEPIFYAYYRRPKQKSLLFGLISYTDPSHVTDRVDQTGEDIVRHIEAFAKDDREYLERVF